MSRWVGLVLRLVCEVLVSVSCVSRLPPVSFYRSRCGILDLGKRSRRDASTHVSNTKYTGGGRSLLHANSYVYTWCCTLSDLKTKHMPLLLNPANARSRRAVTGFINRSDASEIAGSSRLESDSSHRGHARFHKSALRL